MEKADSKVTGYAIEWKVEPSLWSEDEKETVELDRIAFTLYAKRIRGETTDVSLDKDQFWQQAEALVKRVVKPSYVLPFGREFRLKEPEKWIRKDDNWQRYQELVCASLVSINYRSRLRSKDRDTEREARNCCVEIIKRSDDPTLRGVLGYYSLALEGADQLATAGNLYMAMEELLARFNEGKKKKDWRWEEVANQLVQFNSKLSKDNLLTLKQLHRERHAIDDNGNRNVSLPSQELAKDKRLVREYLLAYVEWLKKRS